MFVNRCSLFVSEILGKWRASEFFLARRNESIGVHGETVEVVAIFGVPQGYLIHWANVKNEGIELADDIEL